MAHSFPSDLRVRPSPLLGMAIVAIWLNAANAATFIPLGDLPGGEFASEAYAVSDDGSVVVGFSAVATREVEVRHEIVPWEIWEAFRWTAEAGMVSLGGLPGEPTRNAQALGISADGSVIVGGAEHFDDENVDRAQAFRWTEESGMVGLGFLPGGEESSLATDVSADGSVVVGYSEGAAGREAFVWSAADGMTGLGDLPGGGFDSIAVAVSADGTVIAGSGSSASHSLREAYRWTAETGMVGLGVLPGRTLWSTASDVSGDAAVIVGQSFGADVREAYRWTAATGMQRLGNFATGANQDSGASAVSDDGGIVVGFGTIGDREAGAFIWTEIDGLQVLQEYLTASGVTAHADWQLRDAYDISANGLWIVGSGTNPSGKREAFLVNISSTLDTDGDGLLDADDNCQLVVNTDQTDTDNDSIGDVCDDDDDNDQVPDAWEMLNGFDSLFSGDAGFDPDGDGLTNLEEFLAGTDPNSVDTDNDTVGDATDNCALVANALQTDTDSDGEGDACDADDDNDGFADRNDDFPLDPNRHADVIGSRPTALADTATTTAGTQIRIAVLANDLDLIDGPMSVTIVSGPANGTATVLQTTNEIAYTPNTGFSGDDSFSYAVTDIDGESSEAEVSITVTGTGDADAPASGTSNLQPPPVVRSGGVGGMSPFVILLVVLLRLLRRMRMSASACVATLLVTLLPLPAGAQPQASEAEPRQAPPEMITVIGSHIDGIDPEGLAPTTIIDRVEIELSGTQTVGELFEQLPMNNGGTFNDRDALASSFGGTAISFRGLGPSAVLLLLNGRRMTTYGFPRSAEFGSIVSFVDANNIPLAAVDRIEILKDGASALYGSEAHAGVINIVLRDSFVGTEAELRLGASDASGADEKSLNVLHGWVEQRTSVRLIASHTDREQLAWRDRAISASADRASRGGVDQRSLAATNFDVDGIGLFGAECEERNDSPGNPAFTEIQEFGICLYDPNREIVVPSATRSSLMALIDREIGERMLLRFEASYQTTEATGRRDPISWSGALFPSANPWNPFGQDVLAEYRFTELGPRIDSLDNDASRAVLALRGNVSGWDWELGIMHHSAVTENAQQGYLSADRVEQALNGVDLNGNGQLEADEYWNLYSPASNPNSLALTSSLAASTLRRSKTALTAYNASFSGLLKALRFGNLRAAFGLEERHESLDDRSDPLSLGSLLAATTVQRNWFGMRVDMPFDEIDPFEYVDPWEVQTGTVAASGFASASGSRSLRSAFGELLIPLLPRLELQAAVRLEDGDDLDVEVVPRIALRYDPTARMRLRSSWGEGYRAPSLAELHAGPSTILQSSWDPRRCPEEGFLIPELAGGCVVRSFVTAAWGNPNLVPETSESFNVSVEFDLFDEHSMAVDCWNTDISDKIVSAQTAWFIRHELDLPKGFIVRDPLDLDDDTQFSPDPEYPGAIAQVNVLPLNFGRQKASGCDVELSLNWNRSRGDSVEAQVVASHTASNELTYGAGDPAEELAGTYGYPKNRMNLLLTWQSAEWRAGLSGRWTDAFEDTLPGNTVGSHLEWDAQLTYSGFRRTQISVGVENLLDEPPPLSVGASQLQGFPVEFYDVRGRFFYAQLRAALGAGRSPGMSQ